MLISRIISLLMALVFLCLAVSAVGCRGRGAGSGDASGPVAVVDTRLRYNRVGDFPSAVYQSQATSAICWQPWSRETLALARDSGRLLFVLVAVPQQPEFQKVLSIFESNPAVVASLNHETVPVLVDADVSREMALFASGLSGDLQRAVPFPVCIWLTHDADPVAWIPMNQGSAREMLQVFDQSHGTVTRMWKEDPGYMLRNSARDTERRSQFLREHQASMVASTDPGRDVVSALRQLMALYDPYTKGFDRTGSLFPSSLLELLSVTARHPGLQEDLKRRSREVLSELLGELLPSAMFDPLDGGVYAARRGGSAWDLPTFARDCASQARAVGALVEAHHATGSDLALDRAREVMAYIEGQYRGDGGLYVIGLQDPAVPEEWMWTPEEIGRLMPKAQAEWWIRWSGIRGLGNLPSEADPNREFFRGNTLSLPFGVSRVGGGRAGEGLERSEFEQSRVALRNARQKRVRSSFRDRSAHLASSLRVASAAAALYTATREQAYRDKAVGLLRATRQAFSDGRNLRAVPGSYPESVSLGRAYHYGLAIQATLDVAAITGDGEWLLWADDLAAQSAEQFAENGWVNICPEAARMIHVPMADSQMLFGDSIAGLFAIAECRLTALGRPLVPRFSELVHPLPRQAVEQPVTHTDQLLAALMKSHRFTVAHGGAVDGDLMAELRLLPFRLVFEEKADNGRGVPEEGVEFRWEDKNSGVIRSTEQLGRWRKDLGF